MQLMAWLPAKLAAIEFSRAVCTRRAVEGPPPTRLPTKPTPAWQSTLTPLIPARVAGGQGRAGQGRRGRVGWLSEAGREI
jgi:hypothetical protein